MTALVSSGLPGRLSDPGLQPPGDVEMVGGPDHPDRRGGPLPVGAAEVPLDGVDETPVRGLVGREFRQHVARAGQGVRHGLVPAEHLRTGGEDLFAGR